MTSRVHSSREAHIAKSHDCRNPYRLSALSGQRFLEYETHRVGSAIAFSASLLPDSNLPTPKFGRVLFSLSARLEKAFGHRTLTHSEISRRVAEVRDGPINKGAKGARLKFPSHAGSIGTDHLYSLAFSGISRSMTTDADLSQDLSPSSAVPRAQEPNRITWLDDVAAATKRATVHRGLDCLSSSMTTLLA